MQFFRNFVVKIHNFMQISVFVTRLGKGPEDVEKKINTGLCNWCNFYGLVYQRNVVWKLFDRNGLTLRLS